MVAVSSDYNMYRLRLVDAEAEVESRGYRRTEAYRPHMIQ
jgi:hypothetical protein